MTMASIQKQEPSSATSLGATPSASGQPSPTKAADWRRAFGLREMGVFYALLLLVALLSFATIYLGKSNYLSILNVNNVMYQASLTALMAVAMTVVLITGNFDLSVASVAALSGAILVGFADAYGFWPAFGLSMCVAICAGLLNGAIVQFVGINAFIVTLGTLTAIRGLMLIYTDGRSLAVENADVVDAMKAFESGRLDVGYPLVILGAFLLLLGFYKLSRQKAVTPTSIGLILGGLALAAFSWAGNFVVVVKNPVIYMGIYTAAVWFVLRFTTIGRKVYAVGGNPEAARLSGINVTLYRLGAFVLCSATAGFAGILFASRLRSINPAGLQGAELTVIAAAILGGTSLFGGAGSVVKTLAGALLLYSLTNGFNILDLGANYQGLIEGIVLVSAAAIYTVGGKRMKSKTG